MTNREPIWLPVLLPFQKVEILINRCPTQITHPRQLAYIQLLVFEGGIVAEEHGGNIVYGCLWSADLCSLGFGVCHTRPHTLTDDTQLQFGKHTRHLDKGVCHRVDLTVGAIHGDAPHNHQPQSLRLDGFDNLTQLLSASGKAGNLQYNDGISFLGFRKHRLLPALDLGIAMLVLHKNLFCSRSFQFPHLAIDVLSRFVVAASGITVIHNLLSTRVAGLYTRPLCADGEAMACNLLRVDLVEVGQNPLESGAVKAIGEDRSPTDNVLTFEAAPAWTFHYLLSRLSILQQCFLRDI